MTVLPLPQQKKRGSTVCSTRCGCTRIATLLIPAAPLLQGRHLTHVCDRWSKNRTSAIQLAFFNGDGYEAWDRRSARAIDAVGELCAGARHWSRGAPLVQGFLVPRLEHLLQQRPGSWEERKVKLEGIKSIARGVLQGSSSQPSGGGSFLQEI